MTRVHAQVVVTLIAFLGFAGAAPRKKYAVEDLDPQRFAKIVGRNHLVVLTYAPWLSGIKDIVDAWNEVGEELMPSPIWIARLDTDVFTKWKEEHNLWGLPGIAYFPKSILPEDEINPAEIKPRLFSDQVLTVETLQSTRLIVDWVLKVTGLGSRHHKLDELVLKYLNAAPGSERQAIVDQAKPLIDEVDADPAHVALYTTTMAEVADESYNEAVKKVNAKISALLEQINDKELKSKKQKRIIFQKIDILRSFLRDPTSAAAAASVDASSDEPAKTADSDSQAMSTTPSPADNHPQSSENAAEL